MPKDKPMDETLRKQILVRLGRKDTDELVEIWKRNGQEEWSELAFDVIREILEERQVELPPQDEPGSQSHIKEMRPEIDRMVGIGELEEKIKEGEVLLQKASGKVTGAWTVLVIVTFVSISLALRSIDSGAWLIIAGMGALLIGLNVWRLSNANKEKNQTEADLKAYRDKKAELQADNL